MDDHDIDRWAMTPNLPSIIDEVTTQFEVYERALVSNDIAVLDEFFWRSDDVVRFGIGENLYGSEAIAAYRRSVPPGRISRSLVKTVVTTFGAHTATVSAEFAEASGAVSRQTQTWIRLAEGWRIVTAHVSVMAAS
jgi:Protein of unknown function (DUF3225)